MAGRDAEVSQLHAAYCDAIDHVRAEELAALFVPDGVLSINGKAIATGEAALAAFANTSPRGVHLCGPAFLAGDGSARTSFVFHAPEAGRLVSGYYTDWFARDADGTLRFQQRDIEIAITWPNKLS